MSDSDLARTQTFYDAVASTYAELLPDTSVEAPLDLGALDQFIALLPDSAAVLDAGCGAGRMLEYLRSRNVTGLAGVDLSPAMIAIAQKAHPDLPLAVADINALPHAAGAFDGVLSWYSIIHIAPHDCAPVIAEFARVLAPDGVLLLAYQAGIGERMVGAAYGQDLTLRAHLHRTAHLTDVLAQQDFEVVASVDRAPRAHERNAQGFIIARRR